MQTLFYFRSIDCSFEILADTYPGALIKLARIMGRDEIKGLQLKSVTQNYECPRCSCKAEPCAAA